MPLPALPVAVGPCFQACLGTGTTILLLFKLELSIALHLDPCWNPLSPKIFQYFVLGFACDYDEVNCYHCVRLDNTQFMSYRILYSISVVLQRSTKQTKKFYKIKLKSERQYLDTLSHGNKISFLWIVPQDYFKNK